MKEETWQPPADAIEREARALDALTGMCMPRDLRDLIARRNLRERHRREGPLVEFLRVVGDSRLTEFGWASSARTILAAHARLDDAPEPTLRDEVFAIVAEMTSAAYEAGRKHDSVLYVPYNDRLEAALARAKGGAK